MTNKTAVMHLSNSDNDIYPHFSFNGVHYLEFSTYEEVFTSHNLYLSGTKVQDLVSKNENLFSNYSTLPSTVHYDSFYARSAAEWSRSQPIIVSSEKENITIDQFYDLLRSVFPSGEKIDFDLQNILLPGVRILNSNTVLFELPPGHRYFSYKNSHRFTTSQENYDRTYYLPVPWQVYIARFDDQYRTLQVQMYFAKSSIYSHETQLYYPPLLNFYSNGTLCRPSFSDMDSIEGYSKDISGVVASAYDWIWNSNYNIDIVEGLCHYFNSGNVSTMNDVASKPNPNFIKAITNYALKYSLSQIGNSTFIKDFYTLWESIPLEKILEVDWISFATEADLYQYSLKFYVDRNKHILEQYRKEKNLSKVCFESDDEQHDHDEEQEYEEYDSDVQNLYTSADFINYAYNIMYSHPRTVSDAYLLHSNGIMENGTRYHNNVQNIGSYFMKLYNNIVNTIINLVSTSSSKENDQNV